MATVSGTANNRELWILEDKLEEFEAWFAANNPPPARFEVLSFAHVSGSDAVAYRVRTFIRSDAAAARAHEKWGGTSRLAQRPPAATG